MRGNITVKEPGRVYELRVSLGRDPTTGKYRQKSLTIRGSRAEAERMLRRLIKEVEGGPARPVDSTPTLGELLDEWLAFTEAAGRSPTTVERYRNVIEHQLKPALGDVLLERLTTKAFDDLYRDLVRRQGRHDHACRGRRVALDGSRLPACPTGCVTSPPAATRSSICPPHGVLLPEVRCIASRLQRDGYGRVLVGGRCGSGWVIKLGRGR